MQTQKETHPAAGAAPLPRGELFLSPPRRGGRRPGWVVPFVRCRKKKPTPPLRGTPPERGYVLLPSSEGWPGAGVGYFLGCRRAAATALTAAVMTLMSIGGIALTSDHTHLVYQRDILKAGTNAATLATTRHMWTLDKSLSKEAVRAALMPIARRYILANIPESRRERATDSLTITLEPDRTAGTVDIVAEADLGGIMFGSWMYGDVVPITRVDSLSDLEIADGTSPATADETPDETPDKQKTKPVTELVLAVDSTGSMGSTLAGDDSGEACKKKLKDAGRPCDANWQVCMERAKQAGVPCEESRMTIVKRAATDLVNTITADTSRTVAVGLVPWHFRVRLDQATRTRWEDNGWAQYPTRRYYPNPYWGSWEKIGRNSNLGWFPDPHKTTNAGEWHDMPSKPEAWQGCVDQRRMSGDNPPGISATLPTVESLTMGFYSPTTWGPHYTPISYPCRRTDPLPAKPNECFYNPSGLTNEDDKIYFQQPQYNCHVPAIAPLTTDADEIKRKIDALRDSGSATYSTLGAVWGHRLLAPAWRKTWGDAVHPVDAASHVRKMLVLLTDGDDNHLPQDIVQDHRRKACTAAKAAGIEVVTVYAGVPGSRLKSELEKCASPVSTGTDQDDPNSFTAKTEEELEDVFDTIGQRLRPLRLVR